MTTFIKTKFKISDDQTNIDTYRLAVNITEYHGSLKVMTLRSLDLWPVPVLPPFSLIIVAECALCSGRNSRTSAPTI